MEPKQKKNRGENWGIEEREQLVNILQTYGRSILRRESSKIEKDRAWAEVAQKMRSCGFNRTLQQMKDAWKREKLSAKKTVSFHTKAIKETGGGPSPRGPDNHSLLVASLISKELVEDTSNYDCDDVSDNF